MSLPFRSLLAVTLALILSACSLRPDVSTTPKAPESDLPEAQLFFYYRCIHCNDTYFEQLKPLRDKYPDLNIEELPVNWSPLHEVAARAYYAAEAAGINPGFHEAAYTAYRINHSFTPDADDFARIAESCCGITAQAFLDIYHRKAIGLKVQQADALSRMLNVRSVPFIVKDGQRLPLEWLELRSQSR